MLFEPVVDHLFALEPLDFSLFESGNFQMSRLINAMLIKLQTI
jgi:hypothetical protein